MIDFDKLDKLIHEKGRLSIMTLLAARAEWSFQELKAELGMSDGNLVTHLRMLGETGYLSAAKSDPPEGRPRTTYTLSAAGRTAFQDYLALLEKFIAAGKG